MDFLEFEKIKTVDEKKYKIFSVVSETKKNPDGKNGEYVKIKSPDWVSAIVKITNRVYGYVLVKQYRHGADKVLSEFPCGMVEEGETPLQAIIRECQEEIGITENDIVAIRKLYEANPNPAFMNNKMTCYEIVLNEDFSVEDAKNNRNLDENEFIAVELVQHERVSEIMCEPDTSVMMKMAWASHLILTEID